MTADERIAAIREVLRSAREDAIEQPNLNSGLARECRHYLIELQMTMLAREEYAGYSDLREEVQATWKQIDDYRDERNREAIERGLNYKKPYADGGKA